MKFFTILLIAFMSLHVFAVDISKVQNCGSTSQENKLPETLTGRFRTTSEYVAFGELVTTKEHFVITPRGIENVPQIYSDIGEGIIKEAHDNYCISISARDKKFKDRLRIKLIARYKGKFALDKTVITFYLHFNARSGKYFWNYKISERSYLLYVLPAGSGFWSDEYSIEKM